jgi:hypothetical protein
MAMFDSRAPSSASRLSGSMGMVSLSSIFEMVITYWMGDFKGCGYRCCGYRCCVTVVVLEVDRCGEVAERALAPADGAGVL